MGWLPWPVLPKKQWPQIRYGPKRAITEEEHQQIIERERNPERRSFYELMVGFPSQACFGRRYVFGFAPFPPPPTAPLTALATLRP